MTSNPITIRPETMAIDALNLMERKYKKPINIIPVTSKDNEFLGFLRLHDLIQEVYNKVFSKIMQKLKWKFIQNKIDKIKLAVFDVDGVFTDGYLNYDSNGQQSKILSKRWHWDKISAEGQY